MTHWQDEFQKILKGYYQGQLKKNSRYSVRALAAHLNIAPSSASALLRDDITWKMSSDWAIEVLDRVNVKASEKKRLMALMGLNPQLEQEPLGEMPALAIEHWAYWPVLCCFDIKDLEASPQRIAQKLGLSEEEANEIIRDQLKRKFLIQNADGLLQRPKEYLATTDDISSETIRLLHKSHLKQAALALESVAVAEREFQTLTFAGTKQTLEKAKEEIRAFSDRLAYMFNNDAHNDEIFQLSIQLFPIGNPNKNV